MNKSMSLFLLQNCDQAIDALQSIINQNERTMQNFTQRDEILHEIDLNEKILKDLNSELNAVESRITTTRIKVLQSNSSLYGGKIHNPKELQDLESEIKHLNQSLIQMEDQQLDLMFKIETQSTVLKDNGNKLTSWQNEKSNQDQKLSTESNTHRNELQKIMTERGALVSSIDSASLEKYEKLRSAKSGIAVTTVDDNTCEKCGAEITQAVWQKARISSELCFCDTCGRIIYAR
jgi:uncharacterized protein